MTAMNAETADYKCKRCWCSSDLWCTRDCLGCAGEKAPSITIESIGLRWRSLGCLLPSPSGGRFFLDSGIGAQEAVCCARGRRRPASPTSTSWVHKRPFAARGEEGAQHHQ